MSMTRNEVIDEALRLEPIDREFVVRQLISSLIEAGETPLDDGWYEYWIPEIQRRRDDIAAGRTTPLSWEEVKVRLEEMVASKNNS